VRVRLQHPMEQPNHQATVMSEPIASIGTTIDDADNYSSEAFNPLIAQPLQDGTTVSQDPSVPSISASAVLGESSEMPPGSIECRGHNFDDTEHNNICSIIESMKTTGFQATCLGEAVEQIQRLRSWRLSNVPVSEQEDPVLASMNVRRRIRARIFLAYTSNQISCGQRETLRFLVQHRMVDVIVTTGGGIEEDIIKCFRPTYMGDFKLSGRELRKKGINRIGNLLVPNRNYCEFEDWFSPILHKLHDEQDAEDRAWLKKAASEDNELPPRLLGRLLLSFDDWVSRSTTLNQYCTGQRSTISPSFHQH
jgi:deoxyhypusine synthase